MRYPASFFTMADERATIEKIAGLIADAGSILFITGAGISADSGLPTYRGIGGLYNDALTEDGITVEEALAGETLMTRPEITWKYLAQIARNCRDARFNRAHEVIAEFERCRDRVWVLTQNIDGFHQAAGSRNVIDIHGDMHRIACTSCAWRSCVRDYSGIGMPPRCPACGAVVRPEVVLFGEMLPERKVRALDLQLRRGFDLYFTVGTTSVFPYIQRPVLDARARGKPSVEINPSETAVSGIVDIRLRMRAAEALGRIQEEYNKKYRQGGG